MVLCCATKAGLLNVILWVLAMIGLAPVTGGWVDTIEQWIGYDQAANPAVYTYKTVETLDLHAYVFEPERPADGSILPAVVSFHNADESRADLDYIMTLSRNLSDSGYVAITFESRLDGGILSSSASLGDIDQAANWLGMKSEEMGVDPAQITVIALLGQGLPIAYALNAFGNSPSDASSQLDWNGLLGLSPETDHSLPNLLRFLPALSAAPLTD